MHPKCQHFSEKDRKKIQQALVLALWAHRHQKRKDGTPYILHIRGTVWDYLHITRFEKLSAEDIIIMILHDVIEDKKEYRNRVRDTFGLKVFGEVSLISKESITDFTERCGIMTMSIIGLAGVGGIMEYIGYMSGKITDTMGNVIQLPSHKQLHEYIHQLAPQMGNDFRNFSFFLKIASLDETQFERKCADRINNLRYLEKVGLDYIEKNLISTEVYRLKAEALDRHDLAEKLHDGRNGLIARKRDITGIGL